MLIDSFFVRSLLVPALVTVFGRTSAWPGRLRGRADPAESSPSPEGPDAEVELDEGDLDERAA